MIGWMFRYGSVWRSILFKKRMNSWWRWLVAMAHHTLADDLAVEHVEQGGRGIFSLVVVRHGADAFLFFVGRPGWVGGLSIILRRPVSSYSSRQSIPNVDFGLSVLEMTAVWMSAEVPMKTQERDAPRMS